MIYSTLSADSEYTLSMGQNKIDKQPLVLAVDDDIDNLELMSQILDLFGCSCVGALDGKTTLGVIRDRQPDLILLDICLPDINGIELIYQIKQDPKLVDIPIIAVTSLATPEDRDRIFLAGCTDYICKPFNLDNLEITIRRHLH
ncbi:response regulator [Kamptonema sp. UHCC 0994]|uniref:response regulator n=1 Tax=Kamptonema sp. UHCC 0994 TaxID=3031329 RepID=UPI0023BA6AAE|nr:response regulator [Kamptonema sp. UHCC 0994]MDF0556780.1 response regulator [Kamptonema sp. UHCC 0994]